MEEKRLTQLVQRAGSKFDLVLGNPPWGGEYDRAEGEKVLRDVNVAADATWDSWEIFLALAVKTLKPGGRFALLVPDTLFSADKQRTRDWLMRQCKLEKVYSLGPDWFTSKVRMGTVVLQGRVNSAEELHRIQTMVLAGRNRSDAQDGRRPLTQLEATLAQSIMQDRCRRDEARQIPVLASDEDLELLKGISDHSVTLGALSEHQRGDEINADGLLWRCGNCMSFTVPGEKARGGGYKNKRCPHCGGQITSRDIAPYQLIADMRHGPYNVPYIDGNALTRRYEKPIRRYIRADLEPLFPALKPAEVFRGPKILIRQAGVGVTATLVQDDARCPQSVYIYRVTDAAREEGYTNEFLLACLVSRTMNFVIMKRYAEIDPARAFAKLTHARIVTLPIPKLADRHCRELAKQISERVTRLSETHDYGGDDDREVELSLRMLWGLTADEGRYINGFFSALPEGQAIKDLFPSGVPAAVPFPKEHGNEESESPVSVRP